MQFKNPEILYFLFLLLIPILIHLFQLRRFKKTAFTNVAFLETIVQNTRKSNTLKKWLILITRLAALAGLIIAFAQPFFPQTHAALKEQETVIFIDNSYSMESKGKKGALLHEAKQDLLASLPKDKTVTLATWDKQLKDFDPIADRSELLDLEYTSQTTDAKNLILQLKSLFSNDQNTLKRLILISDFQDLQLAQPIDSSDVTEYRVQLKPVSLENFSIDSLVVKRNASNLDLKVLVSSSVLSEAQLPISFYNKNKLITKAAAKFNNSDTASVSFRLNSDEEILGKISIEDDDLIYDNQFYFSLNKTKPIKVLAISNTDDDFLKRLYREPEYELTTRSEKELDYSLLADQNLIILNEVNAIPASLINQLKTHTQQGGTLILIPNMSSRPDTYSSLLNTYGFMPFGKKSTDALRITDINYDHPLYDHVFNGRSANLQSHVLESYYTLNAKDPILKLENGAPFLAQNNGLYVFTGAINTLNSNFINGQLIVPTFDKIALKSLALPRLFYELGAEVNYDVEAQLPEDAVAVLENGNLQIIPMQEKKGDKLSILQTPGLTRDGVYALKYKQDTLALTAYNYNRSESRLNEVNLENADGLNLQNTSIPSLFDRLEEATNLNLLSKWFVIFALLAFLSEMLIIKYSK